jgi:uncharacterized delta-60 repeat protein
LKLPATALAAPSALLALLLAATPAVPAPGDLDPTFGTGGRTTTSFAQPSRAEAVARQPDGKLVVAGGASIDLAFARYLPGGTLDPDFGAGGLSLVPLGDVAGASSVVVQPDEAILAAGFVFDRNRFSIALARVLSDGTLDPGFGDGGTVVTKLGQHSAAAALALAPDGGILIAGSVVLGGRFAIAVLRYLPDGRLDKSFGRQGKVTVKVDGDAEAWSIALQHDGRILVGGYLPSGILWIPAVFRFLPNGTPDPTFGDGGVAIPLDSLGGIVRGVAAQPDGHILASFESDLSPTASLDFAIARLEADGRLDATFGDGGISFVDFTDYDVPHAIALLADGTIAVGGDVDGDMGIARLTRTGQPDAGFGTAGRTTIDFGSDPPNDLFYVDLAYGLAPDPDGRLVIAGTSGFHDENGDPNTVFSLARVEGVAATCGDASLDADEECDFGAANGTTGACCSALCRFVSAGTACRASSGACDLAERCSGADGDCPADGGITDADGDGTCDALDGCTAFGTSTGAATSADLVVTAGKPGTGDRITLTARIPLASERPSPISPRTPGVHASSSRTRAASAWLPICRAASRRPAAAGG